VVRAWEDGRTETVEASEIADAPQAVALVAGGLDPAAWREWVAARFGYAALDVAEGVARTYAEDVAAGAALWALERQRKSGAVAVPPVVPGVGEPATDASTMSDFGAGRSASDFGEGQSMAEFKDPARMSDFGDGRSMDEFGDGRRMADSGTQPTAPAPGSPPPAPIELPPPLTKPRNIKLQLAAAAAVVAVVAAGSTAVIALAGNNNTGFPVNATPPPAPPTTQSPDTTTLDGSAPGFQSTEFTQGTRTYDIEYTFLTSTVEEHQIGVPVKATFTVSCLEREGICWTDLLEDGEVFAEAFRHAVVVPLEPGELDGTSVYPDPTDDCGGEFSHSIVAEMDGETIQGEGEENEIPSSCDSSPGAYTFEFSGTLRSEAPFVVGNPPSTIPQDDAGEQETTSTTFPSQPAPAPPEASG
jgi:hypothetical protein